MNNIDPGKILIRKCLFQLQLQLQLLLYSQLKGACRPYRKGLSRKDREELAAMSTHAADNCTNTKIKFIGY